MPEMYLKQLKEGNSVVFSENYLINDCRAELKAITDKINMQLKCLIGSQDLMECIQASEVQIVYLFDEARNLKLGGSELYNKFVILRRVVHILPGA